MREIKDIVLQLPSRYSYPRAHLRRNGYICLVVQMGKSVGSIGCHVLIVHVSVSILAGFLCHALVAQPRLIHTPKLYGDND